MKTENIHTDVQRESKVWERTKSANPMWKMLQNNAIEEKQKSSASQGLLRVDKIFQPEAVLKILSRNTLDNKEGIQPIRSV